MLLRIALQFLLIIFLSDSPSFAQDNSAQELKKLTMTAKIENLEKIKKYIKKDSYFQLAKLSDKNEIDAQVSKGRILISTNFEKVYLKDDNTITIQQNNLKPGKYLIALQLITPLPKPTQPGVFVPGDGAKLVINLSNTEIKKEINTSGKIPYFFLCNNEKLLVIDISLTSESDINFDFPKAHVSTWEW